MNFVADVGVARPAPSTARSLQARRASPRLALLGGFDLRFREETVTLPMTAQRVLAFLALRDRPMLRLYVAGCLWPETTEARASANLRSALWRLGRPGLGLIDASNGHLGLVDHVDIDVRRSAVLARQLLDDEPGLPEEEADPRWLAEDILPDWSEEWVVMEREHFRQLRLHALESLCRKLTASGRYAQAVGAGLAAVAAEPLRESAHRTLIEAHVAEGNVKEALHQYGTFRRLLHDELDLEPSEAMEDLMRRVNLRPID
jgi:DNA-binding SARP family transcriptional activator